MEGKVEMNFIIYAEAYSQKMRLISEAGMVDSEKQIRDSIQSLSIVDSKGTHASSFGF